MINKRIKFGMFLIIGILLMSFGSSYMRSNPKYTQISSQRSLGSFDKSMCEAGQDFIIQIAPFGCTPAVVRSDLLEEQNVPVFCQLGATKINPLIDVEAIEGVSFKGKYPKEVSGVGFHPAKAALGVKGDLNSPVLNNIGYVVIVLKKQKNESSMPEFVQGNLTAKIRYDIKNAFGIGRANFYLPEMSDKEWEDKHVQYGFWDGRGYLRAEGIDESGATILIYDDVKKISSVNLKKGETSRKIYLPGFDCLAGLQLKLNGLEAPDTRAKLRVNADVVEVKEGEKFLENRCRVKNIDKQGLVQTVSINCKEDEGSKNFVLSISPKVELEIDGIEKREFVVGDKLYEVHGGEKFVYLGYIGESSDGVKFIIPVVSPARDSKKFKDTLIFKKLPEIVKVAQHDTGNPIFNLIKGAFSITGGGILNLGNFLTTGNYPVGWIYEKGSGKNEMSDAEKYIRGVIAMFPLGGQALIGLEFIVKEVVGWLKDLKETEFIGFAGAYNKGLQGDAKIYYDNAMEDYQTIIDSFPESKDLNNDKITFGEQALVGKIKLAEAMGQKKTLVELCEEFKGRYSKSTINLKSYCDNKYKLSSSEVSSRHVSVNGRVKQISFDGIYEPSFKEYGVEVFVSGFDEETNERINEQKKLVKNAEIFLLGTDSIQLVGLDENYATIKINVEETTAQKITEVGTEKRIKLNDYVTNIGKNKYKITVNKINLKKSARVSVIPSINNAGTEANFSFKIGIEKRAIELSPEKTRKKIKELNETIEDWEEKSEQLGKVVKGLKGACLVTSGALMVKNFFANVGGKAIARKNVMGGEGGWYERCAKMVPDTYYSQEECMVEESKNIDKEVDTWYKAMKEQNDKMKNLQEGITETSVFGERVVNDDEFMKKYSGQVQNYLDNRFREGEFENPDNPSEFIDMEKMKTILSYDSWKNNGNYDKEQLRDIELYTKVLESNPEDAMAKKRLYSELLDVKINSENYAERSNLKDELEKSNFDLGVSSYGDESAIVGTYSGGTITANQIRGVTLDEKKEDKTINYPVEVITYNGKKYVAILEGAGANNYVAERVYEYKEIENGVIQVGGEKKDIAGKFKSFKKYDRASYQNEYKSSLGDTVPCLRYYETEPYKGLPAIVPFNLKEGWYAYVGQTLPIMGKISSYDASGRVSSFWVCNVGKNGREENKGGDDICQMINTGTGQPYNVFHGLSSGDASRLVQKAVQSIEEASKKYKSGLSGKVTINGQRVKVCRPMADVPEMQCQDFMSPKDCQLLFNVCDPVICPSSRCDFGGAYAVKDVIQSGIIGSIFLCLPNIREGIYIPVCLTGIKAGIDGLLSVYKSYRDCLQESLDTGAMVGICDEIYSIHLCEFFWRQTIPLANILIPKMMEFALGQNVHGGGEYLGVASAWENAGNSVNYFTQYYAANSFKAFKARSTEEVGGEVCKSFVSGVYPEGGNLLDALTEPDSPPQFHGRFDEIPFTSTTVPPISQYKVFFHIFAGKDSRAYYQVYLRGGAESSFYQDTSNRRIVASGYIATGGYASETKDFTAPSGYKELCIVVNNQEECGFKEVSTSFAVNYVKDQYLASQAKEMDVKTEKECISGTASVYSLLNPNIQSGADEMFDPAIYKRGIIRICATDNPGKGTDSYSGTENSRWKQVGYCGDKKIKCWLDSESVKDVIKNTDIEGDVLKKQSDNYLDILMSEGDYVENFGEEVDKIEEESDLKKKINLINGVIERVFFNNQKAHLFLLRGNAYGELASRAYAKLKKEILEKTGREKIEAVSEISKDYSSIVFEFQDGKISANFFFKYSGGKWWWNRYKADKNFWVEVPKFTKGGDSWNFDEKNKEFIESLEGKNFNEGLKLLVDRTTKNKEGFWSFGSTELVTENVDLSNKGVFTVRQEDEGILYKTSPLYFKYESNKWSWSPDEKIWIASPELEVKEGAWKGKSLVEENIKLIQALDGEGFDEGVFIIFTHGEVSEGRLSEGDCKKVIGEKILEIAKEKKTSDEKFKDEQVEKETGAKNFECLILQIAMQESGLKHCKEGKEGKDCLECDGKGGDVFGERDKGVMQINSIAHGGVDVNDFEKNVKYGVNLLIEKYDLDSKKYVCNGETYSGWKQALRFYNGWNTKCFDEEKKMIGDHKYVEHVLGQEIQIKTWFLECRDEVVEEKKEEVEEKIVEEEITGTPQEKVLKVIGELDGKTVEEICGNKTISCWKGVKKVYDIAGLDWNCIFTDGHLFESPVEYSFKGQDYSPRYKHGTCDTCGCSFVRGKEINCEECNKRVNLPENLKAGDIIQFLYDVENKKWVEHNVIFIEWEDEPNRIARVFHRMGEPSEFKYGEFDFSEYGHRITQIWQPVEKVSKVSEKKEVPKTYEIKEPIVFKQEGNKVILKVEHDCDSVRHVIRSPEWWIFVKDEVIVSTTKGESAEFPLSNKFVIGKKYYADVECYKGINVVKKKRSDVITLR